MGDWRAEFAPHPEPARRRGLMDTADVVSTVMGMFAMLLAIGIPIAFVGLVIWLFFSLMGDPAPEVSPSPQAGADRVPSWVVGYVAGPGRTELTLVVEACDEWNLDETWTSKQDAAHVELWVGWWSMSLPPCEAPELRTFEFGLLEPLGDRTVFLLGGGEVPRFEGELPPGDS